MDSNTNMSGNMTNDNYAPLTIGVENQISNGGWAPATFDDVRVYNRALSATEVRELYNLGK